MFIKCNAEFRKPDVTDALWDSYTEEQKHENIHMRKFRFKPDDIQTYNQHSSGYKTTLWFKNGETWVIDIPIEKLDKILEDLNIKFSNISNN